MTCSGSTNELACSAPSTVSTGGRSSYSTFASLAALRAAMGLSAITANRTWPWNSTTSRANTGSSPAPIGDTSLAPGMSAAVSTNTTPGAVRTLARSMLRTRACARAEKPGAACSVPAGSGMSST
jgi:hypothetical protein